MFPSLLPQSSNMKHIFLQRQSPSLQSLPSPSRSIKPDNTLRALTEKFVQLIRNAPDQTIEIDEASQRLSIQKRRIYDITNVLEGIGYIEKLGKNLMKWVGGVQGGQLEQQAAELDEKILNIDCKTARVQEQIATFKRLLQQETRSSHSLNFLNNSDLQSLMDKNGLKRMAVYSGEVGDHMVLDANPENKCTQCSFENRNITGRIYACCIKMDKMDVYEIKSEEVKKENKIAIQDQMEVEQEQNEDDAAEDEEIFKDEEENEKQEDNPPAFN